jgi:hypothetical protein
VNIITKNVGAWLAATIVALLTIFSDKILERIRFRLNRANLRTKYFEELATDLSTYLFYSEIFHERYQKHWANNTADMDAIRGEINGAITTLRKKEYVYRAWVKRYWGSARTEPFAQVMAAVKSTDDAIHAFNDLGNEKEKTDELGKRLETLRARVDEWLSQPDAWQDHFRHPRYWPEGVHTRDPPRLVLWPSPDGPCRWFNSADSIVTDGFAESSRALSGGTHRRERAGSFAIRQSKSILARSCEADGPLG